MGSAINSALGFITNSFNLHSASAWISIALAALACILFTFDIRERRQKTIIQHEQQKETLEPDTARQEEQKQRTRERRWRFFPANYR